MENMSNQLRIVYNWVAPEVLFGQPVSFVSDIYSLCAVLWESIRGACIAYTLVASLLQADENQCLRISFLCVFFSKKRDFLTLF